MFNTINDSQNEVTLNPSYGCQSSYQTLDLSQLTFFKSGDAFAQTFVAQTVPDSEDAYYFQRTIEKYYKTRNQRDY